MENNYIEQLTEKLKDAPICHPKGVSFDSYRIEKSAHFQVNDKSLKITAVYTIDSSYLELQTASGNSYTITESFNLPEGAYDSLWHVVSSRIDDAIDKQNGERIYAFLEEVLNGTDVG